jgi:hypothetical protein
MCGTYTYIHSCIHSLTKTNPHRKNHKIRVVEMATREVRDFSGSGDQASRDPSSTPDGPRDTCSFNFPGAMSLDRRLQRLVVSDLYGLREVDLQTGSTRTVVQWTGHYHALKRAPWPAESSVAINDFADGPLEVASLGSRSSLPDKEIDSDRRAPIVEMYFSNDGKTLFFVNVVRDFIRTMSVAGPSGVSVTSSVFKDNLAPQGGGMDVYGAQALVAVNDSTFSGVCVCIYVSIYIYMCVCVCMCMYVCVYVYNCHVYVCICVYMCVCV